MLETTGEEDQPQAIGLAKGRFLDLPVKDDELLPKESVLGDEFGLTARQVSRRAKKQGRASGLGEMLERLIEYREQVEEELSYSMRKGSHLDARPKSCQRLSAHCRSPSRAVNLYPDGVFGQHRAEIPHS